MKPVKNAANRSFSGPAAMDCGKWLVLVTVLGFGLRIFGVQFGLPYLYHADEPIVVNHALAYSSGDLNPHFFKIPPLLSYLLFGVYGLSYLAGRAAGFFQSPADFESLFFRDPSFFYISARVFFGVLPGTASILLFFRMIRRSFSARTALLGAFLLSVCFLHVRDSHYIYADIPLFLILILIFDRIFAVLEHPENLRLHLSTGALLGLACAVKYNAAFFAAPYIAAVLMSRPKGAAGKTLFAGLAAVLVFLFCNPYALLDSGTFLREISIQARSQTGTPWTHHLRHSLLEGVGPAAMILAFTGLARALMHPDPKKILFAVFAGVYYLVLVKAGQPYDRYVLPLLVPVLFFAADSIENLAGGRKFRKSVFLLLSALIAVPNLGHSLLFDFVVSEKDTRTLAKEWAEASIPENSGIALGWEFYLPRLQFSKEQLLEKKSDLQENGIFSGARGRRLNFYLENPPARAFRLFFLRQDAGALGEDRPFFGTPVAAYDLKGLREKGVDYVMLPVLSSQRQPAEFYESLAARADLIKTFSPYKDHAVKPSLDPQPLTGGPFLWKDLISRARNGVPIEIYKLREA